MRDAILVVVGDCPGRKYWSAADRGDDHGGDRNGDCACVFTFAVDDGCVFSTS